LVRPLLINSLKGTVHPKIILLKYVMLITVNKTFTIIITKYTWYNRYKEVFQITGAPPLPLHRKVSCSDVTWARSSQSSHKHQLLFPVLLGPKQSESSYSCNVPSGSNWYVSHDVNLVRLLRFVPELFLANSCLLDFKWVIRITGHIAWFKWRQHSGLFNMRVIFFTFWHHLRYLRR